jgi:hypothetical protein
LLYEKPDKIELTRQGIRNFLLLAANPMSSPRRLPASFRYFKARLLSLSRPAVWMPALFLTLVGAFLLEYSTHPDWFGYDEDNEGPNQSELGETLSPEDLSVAAEIDNLDVLSNDFLTDAPRNGNQNNNQSNNQGESVASPNPEPSPTLSAGDRYLANQDNSVDLPGASNSRTPSLDLFSDFFNPASRSGATAANTNNMNRGNGTGMTNNVNDTSTATMSPLQQALNAQTAANAASESDSAENSANAPANNSTTQTTAGAESTTGLADSSTDALLAPLPAPASFIRTSSQMSPPPGTTGYTQPTVVNQAPLTAPAPTGYPIVPPAAGVPNASGVAVPTNGYSNGYVPGQVPQAGVGTFGPALSQPIEAQPSQFAPTPAPFSAPRRAPGRYLGNGEINTFSNP